MGQKVSPIGLRVGIIRDWDTKWYASKTQVADLLHEDLKIRNFLNDFYKNAYVARIEIKRTGKKVIVSLHTAKPGAVIGREGSKKNEAVKKLEKLTGKHVYITVVEIKTSISFALNLAIISSFSFGRILPWSISTLNSFKTSL